VDALSILTGLLALTTGYYAWQTKRMVDEMRATRDAQIRSVDEMRRTREAEILPVLVPHTELIDPRQPQVHFGVKNVGKGPATSVDVIIRWTEFVRFRLRCPVLEPHEVRWVKTMDRDIHPDAFNPATLPEGERTLLLTGNCRDVTGTVHPVNATAPFFDLWEHNISDEMARAIEEEWRALRNQPPVDPAK
jgi:hypothetical protein